MTVAEHKRALRRTMRERLRAMDPRDRAHQSTRIVAAVQECPKFSSADHVGLYWALPDEPEVGPLLETVLKAGKGLWLPKMESPETGYQWARIRSLESDLRTGAFGIPEPGPNCEKKPPNRLDFVLIPGLAFSRFGARLGRGKGFYDRLAPTVPGWKAGVAFDFQLTDEIPTELHDVLLDYVFIPR